ncbi:MAG: MBL fold metallo-hydrolase [Deltaproteobacteria bacterium]|nr:MBL fold metallo-hydrolase [Deltaproteobacteria bacterium]
MKLHILGCGDAFGSGGRNNSGYLVEAGDRIFLLDCGPATLPAMKRAGFDTRRLDAIFLSHLHGDHCGGLPFFFLEYLYEKPRAKPLHVAGPAGSEERVRGLFQSMFGDVSEPKELPPTLFHVLEPDREAVVAGIVVFPFRVPHQVRAISLALKVHYERKQILYSGDSPWTDLFITHARGTDVFLCECSFFDRETTNHMNYQRIRQNLSRLECRTLILTHMGEEMLARRAEVDVLLAEDGMVLEIRD